MLESKVGHLKDNFIISHFKASAIVSRINWMALYSVKKSKILNTIFTNTKCTFTDLVIKKALKIKFQKSLSTWIRMWHVYQFDFTFASTLFIDWIQGTPLSNTPPWDYLWTWLSLHLSHRGRVFFCMIHLTNLSLLFIKTKISPWSQYYLTLFSSFHPSFSDFRC